MHTDIDSNYVEQNKRAESLEYIIVIAELSAHILNSKVDFDKLMGVVLKFA